MIRAASTECSQYKDFIKTIVVGLTSAIIFLLEKMEKFTKVEVGIASQLIQAVGIETRSVR